MQTQTRNSDLKKKQLIFYALLIWHWFVHTTQTLIEILFTFTRHFSK